MKINSINLNLNNNISLARTKPQNSFCTKILYPADEVSFSRNPAKNLAGTVSILKKSMDENDDKKTAEIMSSFSQQNQGYKGITERYPDKFVSTKALIGDRVYKKRYNVDDSHDLFLNENFMAFRKGKDVVELNIKKGTRRVFQEPRFELYDFLKRTERKFKNDENEECVEDLRQYYIKHPKQRGKTLLTDNGTLKMSKDGRINLYYSQYGYITKSIMIRMNKQNEVVTYSINNSVTNDSFDCKRIFCYNYPNKF